MQRSQCIYRYSSLGTDTHPLPCRHSWVDWCSELPQVGYLMVPWGVSQHHVYRNEFCFGNHLAGIILVPHICIVWCPPLWVVSPLRLTAKPLKQGGFQVRNLRDSKGLFSVEKLVSGAGNLRPAPRWKFQAFGSWSSLAPPAESMNRRRLQFLMCVRM